MSSNRVVDDNTGEILFKCDSLLEAARWMVEREKDLDHEETYAEEIDDAGIVTGWWSLEELLAACVYEEERCRDCAYLIEGEAGIWTCDNYGLPCWEVSEEKCSIDPPERTRGERSESWATDTE